MKASQQLFKNNCNGYQNALILSFDKKPKMKKLRKKYSALTFEKTAKRVYIAFGTQDETPQLTKLKKEISNRPGISAS